jgi:hypothetical protein
MSDNRRRNRRQVLITEVHCEGCLANAQTRVSDISLEGVFIDTPFPLPVGSPLRFKFTLPSGHLVVAEGVVAHSLEGIGMGIAFTAIRPPDKQQIRDFVE